MSKPITVIWSCDGDQTYTDHITLDWNGNTDELIQACVDQYPAEWAEVLEGYDSSADFVAEGYYLYAVLDGHLENKAP